MRETPLRAFDGDGTVADAMHASLVRLLSEDGYLLEKNVMERSITHRLTAQASVRNVGEFLQAINRIQHRPNTHCVLYRGQEQTKDLLPSLFRRFRQRVADIRQNEAKLLERLKAR